MVFIGAADAVTIVGTSGSGKGSLSAALERHGFEVGSEDCAILFRVGGRNFAATYTLRNAKDGSAVIRARAYSNEHKVTGRAGVGVVKYKISLRIDKQLKDLFSIKLIESPDGNGLAITHRCQSPEDFGMLAAALLQYLKGDTCPDRYVMDKAARPGIEPLSDIASDDGLTDELISKLVSAAVNKKRVRAIFDNRLKNLRAIQLIREAFNHVDRYSVYKELVEKLDFVPVSPDRILSEVDSSFDGREYTEDNTLVFVFAGPDRKALLRKISARKGVRSHCVDDSGYDAAAKDKSYYPLPEIVTIALAQYLNPSVDMAEYVKKNMNLKKLCLGDITKDKEAEGMLIFSVLPDTDRLPLNELPGRCARLEELIRNA
jgi:hypothetical protein